MWAPLQRPLGLRGSPSDRRCGRRWSRSRPSPRMVTRRTRGSAVSASSISMRLSGRQCTRALRPFDEHRALLRRLLEAELAGFVRRGEAVEVEMRHREPRRHIGLAQREGRARHLGRLAQRAAIRARANVVLPAPRSPRSASTSPRRSLRATSSASRTTPASSRRHVHSALMRAGPRRQARAGACRSRGSAR